MDLVYDVCDLEVISVQLDPLGLDLLHPVAVEMQNNQCFYPFRVAIGVEVQGHGLMLSDYALLSAASAGKCVV